MSQTKDILKKIRKIELTTKKLVEGLLQGAYHSVFKGRGIEFSEVREYVPGDDIRTIDWNVTARMNSPFVKEFVEERDLTVYILFDVSASNEFGSKISKKDAATELAASIMFAALKNNDSIGLCLFTEKVEHFVRPRKGRKHVLKLIRDIIYFKPELKGTNIHETLRYISNIIKRRGIIFIISDFFSEKNYLAQLRILKKRHDVIAININDIREKEIPDIGYIELEDEETGEQLLLDTSDPDFRENYLRIVKEENDSVNSMLKKLGVDIVELRSDEAYEVPLRRFFRLRQARMVR